MAEDFNGTVYMIRDTKNGKLYIGQTIRPVEKRIAEHFTGPERGCDLLRRAFELSGRDRTRFTWEVLEEGIDDPQELCYRESYYISQYRTVDPDGYNQTFGGGFYSSFKTKGRPRSIRYDLARAYEDGASLRQVAERFGVSMATVRKHAEYAGVEIRPCGSPKGISKPFPGRPYPRRQPRREFIEDYAAGMSLRAIGQKYGVCHRTVREHLRDAGVYREVTERTGDRKGGVLNG